MIELHISENNPFSNEIIRRLEELSLSKRAFTQPEDDKVMLVHNGTTYEGRDSILKYIHELEEFLDKWYECTCDKFD
jgi:hypothetical protein